MVLNPKGWIFFIIVLVGSTAFMIAEETMAYEEPPYTILEQTGLFELRHYKPFLVAEVQVRGHFEDVLQTPEVEGDDGYRFSFIMPTVYTSPFDLYHRDCFVKTVS